jgi:hypothetical protein
LKRIDDSKKHQQHVDNGSEKLVKDGKKSGVEGDASDASKEEVKDGN